MNYLAFGMPGGVELAVIAFVALLIFGRNLPKIAGDMGKAVIEFKKGIKGVNAETVEITGDLNKLSNEIKTEVDKEVEKEKVNA